MSQLTANRFFVQEDAKRATKLSSCQSSSAKTKLTDAALANAAEGTGHAHAGFMQFAENPSFTKCLDAVSEGLDFLEIEELIDTKRVYKKVELDHLTYSVSDQKSCGLGLNCESAWLKINVNDSWLRASDTNELTSLVFHKSLDHIENCDLPPPRKYVSRGRDASSYDGKTMATPFDGERKYDSAINLPIYAQSCFGCETQMGICQSTCLSEFQVF